MAYQSFGDEKGDSSSNEKLAAIKLPSDLSGKSLLDIGCNEGFFCAAALQRGASRVVGIDVNPELVRKAQNRIPGAEFHAKSWWEIGSEKFDYILFLSAIHYEPEQKRLLRRLLESLKPDGTLILEAGAEPDYYKSEWKWVVRHDGLVRFPTFSLLFDDLLDGYSVRDMGKSVMQSGDPQPRYVFHCHRRKPTIVCVSGQSGAGKSNFSRLFAKRNIRTIHLDPTLGYFANLPTGRNQGFVEYIKHVLHECHFDVFRFTQCVERDKRTDEFAQFLLRLAIKDDEITIMEGYPFTNAAISSAFREIATKSGYKVAFLQLD